MLVNEKQMHCWKGYKKKGTKKLPSGKIVNNCVKESTFNTLVNSVLEENSDKKLYRVSHYGLGINEKTSAYSPEQARSQVFTRLLEIGRLKKYDWKDKFDRASVAEITTANQIAREKQLNLNL
jgi:hypothetical protein